MSRESSPVEVIVTCQSVPGTPGTVSSQALQACADRLGVIIQPLHPLTSSPDLAKYFVARVNPAALDGAIREFLACDGVEGAYAKPQGEAP